MTPNYLSISLSIYLLAAQLLACSLLSTYLAACHHQALSLLAVQPLLLWNARISQNASRPLLLLMIPATLVATPLGQLTGEQVLALALALAGLDTVDTETDTGPVPGDTDVVQGVGGVLVSLTSSSTATGRSSSSWCAPWPPPSFRLALRTHVLTPCALTLHALNPHVRSQ